MTTVKSPQPLRLTPVMLAVKLYCLMLTHPRLAYEFDLRAGLN